MYSSIVCLNYEVVSERGLMKEAIAAALLAAILGAASGAYGWHQWLLREDSSVVLVEKESLFVFLSNVQLLKQAYDSCRRSL